LHLLLNIQDVGCMLQLGSPAASRVRGKLLLHLNGIGIARIELLQLLGGNLERHGGGGRHLLGGTL